jgi:GR25 family glycosyltransferase involved in LPS biosynthesis
MSNPFDFFEKIYCINLDSRKDRWEKCKEKFELLGITDRVERFPAITLSHLPDLNPKIRGRAGCALSHAAILRRAIDLKLNNYLVLEDDFDLCHDPDQCLKSLELSQKELPKDWHIFYLGGNLTKEYGIFPLRNFSDNLFNLDSCHTTHSFAVNFYFYDALNKELPTEENVFEWLSDNQAIDVHLSKNVLHKFNSFIPEKMLFIQHADFSDIENNYYDYVDWMKNNFDSFKNLLKNQQIDPLVFVNSSRFDILAKYIYARLLLTNRDTKYGEDIYYNHLKVWNDCKYGDGKNGIEEYTSSFKSLLKSIQENGFDPNKSKINTTEGGMLLNGGHRVASCLVFDKPICFQTGGEGQAHVDYNYFKNKNDFLGGGLEEKYCDSIALEYSKIKPDTFIATIFPSAQGDLAEAEKIIKNNSDIFYSKKVSLNSTGALNLMRQMYCREPWTGSIDNGYPGLKEKASLCFNNGGEATVYLITTAHPNTIEIKKRIRDLFGIGNHSVHINDTWEETFRLARCFFNHNSIEMMNCMFPNYYKSFEDLSYLFFQNLIHNKIDPDDYCITASSVLSVLGLREGKDLDYLHTGPRIDGHPDIDSHNEYSKGRYEKSIDDIIYNPDNHFYFNGLKYASLDVLKQLKEKRREDKDKKDLDLIKKLPIK